MQSTLSYFDLLSTKALDWKISSTIAQNKSHEFPELHWVCRRWELISSPSRSDLMINSNIWLGNKHFEFLSPSKPERLQSTIGKFFNFSSRKKSLYLCFRIAKFLWLTSRQTRPQTDSSENFNSAFIRYWEAIMSSSNYYARHVMNGEQIKWFLYSGHLIASHVALIKIINTFNGSCFGRRIPTNND